MSASCIYDKRWHCGLLSAMPFCCSGGLRGERCEMRGYIKIQEAAKKWGISERRINTLCLEGRVQGAEKFGNAWAIPDDAEKPPDRRIKTGKYIKRK